MDEARNTGRPAVRHGTRQPLLDGILGRLIYVPTQNENGVGEFRGSRAKGQTPRFQQVTSFKQWCPPSRTKGNQSTSTPSKNSVKQQKYWARQTYPDAFVGDECVRSLLTDGILESAQDSSQLSAAATASLLATGEITDIRDLGRRTKGHPALAVASGEAGEILRFISLTKEEWTWESEDVRVDLNTPNPRYRGEWCQDGLPITLIKFSLSPKKYDPIRWLVVQKQTSTTVCEPELRSLAEKVEGSGPAQLFANPLFTIRSDQTGGSSHSDVSLSLFSDREIPQLVIIDQTGCWSVWDITGRRGVRPQVLRPVMMMCGNIVTGLLSALPYNVASKELPHKVMWLAPRKPASRVKSRAGTPAPGYVEEEPQRLRLLLMCNSKAVYLYDVEGGESRPATRALLQNSANRILEVQPSPLADSQGLVLTNTNVIWVACREDSNGKMSLDILASSPHQRTGLDQDLRLDVSPATFIDGLKACFASVRSTKDNRVSIIWFISPQPGMPARYHRQLISLRIPFNFTSVGMLPVTRRVGTTAEAEGGYSALAKAKTRFFQLLTLGHDLKVSVALCVWSEGVRRAVPPPNKHIGSEPFRRSIRIMKRGGAFVVPDGYVEYMDFGHGEKAGLPTLGVSKVRPRKPVRLSLLGSRISTSEDLILGRPEHVPKDINFGFIRETVEAWTRDRYMSRRSLLELIGPGRHLEELLRLASEWTNHRDVLEGDDDLHALQEVRNPFYGLDLDDSVERLEALFRGLPFQGEGELQQRRQRVLQRMAAEIILSAVGISAGQQRPAGSKPTNSVRRRPLETGITNPANFRSSPPVQWSPPQSSQPQPSQFLSSQPELPAINPAAEELDDPTIVHLRKYTPIEPPPTGPPAQTQISLHWDLGGDLTEIEWKPWKVEGAEEEVLRRKRKIEAKRKRAEQLAAKLFSEPLPVVSKKGATSQPVFMTSQPREPAPLVQSPLVQSSSQIPWPAMSQVVPGAFGGRAPLGKKKKDGKKGGFR
ncbi:RNA polymerase I-specific transcription-initiation factor-domain-containing protein [Lasiosphaeris hirsuta]|uniref:RNA polymerase I-specific transcription-initiation factor-domain-containing protein n=1 Tax=Lasiosphaeris hirsuta TaxID=260670 RepID=A0AA40DLJ1_9PEZI|nr:RNA polymerase I-specific transcription-initiation factor-domain-containing protein [Lasiosphaeris hirsuta]